MDYKKKDWGEELYDRVRNAIDNKDFEGFSESVSEILHTAERQFDDMVNQVEGRMGDMFGQAGSQMGEAASHAGQQMSGFIKDAGKNLSDEIGNKAKSMKQRMSKKNPSGKFRTFPGRYLSNVERMIGAVGMGLTGLLLMFLLVAGFSSELESTFSIVLCFYLPMLLLFTALFVHGNKVKKRTVRLKIYQQCWLGLPFIMADQLSLKTGIPLKTVKEDLRYITEEHLLLYGLLDESGTCLLLTPEATAQYELAIMSKRQRDQEAREKESREDLGGIQNGWESGGQTSGSDINTSESDAHTQQTPDPVEEHFLIFYESSQNQQAEIGSLRRQLHDLSLCDKVDTFQQNYGKILSLVDEKHELCLHLDRLKDYYIPSVIKLLTVYHDLENKPMETENILKSKQEISRSIDMMNEAMLKMYDDLFQSTAMDVNADVKVMEMLLKKDGYLS